MNKKTLKKIIVFLLIITILATLMLVTSSVLASGTNADYYIDLSKLTYYKNGESVETSITVYSSDDFDTFVEDYNNGNLPEIYITEFLFDGVGQVKKVSKDDDTSEVTTKTISTTAININCTGSIEFTGTATDTMIAVNTNEVTEDITLILNGIDLTSSSSTPAIMIYNKDVTYSECNVTISTVENTNNYISGGKLKKVSTMTSDRVDEYTSISTVYSDTTSEYYYIFSSDEVLNLLYAQETADNEKISEGDPYTYYKYSGAIGADITVNFEGKGYLEVASQSDEGIELKGNINFIGGTGDYKITSYDDGINASTTGTDIYINVNSMYVSVDADGDEGDAIDSNGTIHVEGGNIYAFSHPTSQDDGLDSDQGTYINGGTVIATGNMSDSVSDNSSQEFIKLNFAEQQGEGTIVCITDTSGNPVMAFESGRSFTTLTYSSPDLEQTTYYVYKNGDIEGTSENGLYTKITSYSNGTQQQWSNGGTGMGEGEMPDGEGQFDDSENPPDKPDGEEGDSETSPEGDDSETPPDKPDGEDSGENNQEGNNGEGSNITYTGNTEITANTTDSSKTYTSTTSNENALLVTGDITVTLSDITATKTGDSDGGDDSNFYGINSAILAKSGAILTISGATITTDAEGANGVFSFGGYATTNNTSSDGTTVYISDSSITTTGDNSGGIMTTGGGIMYAYNLIVNTFGTSSAAIRTDRGGGTVTVDGGTYTTTGSGSPAIYSTANVTVSNAELIANASEGIVIEGANTVAINNCNLTDSNTKLNGQSTTYKNIFLYQSVSGDASDGTSTFSSTDSDIVTNNGDTFYITNTTAIINLTNNTITNNDSDGYLLRAGADSWGNSGSNGGDVTLNATNQTLSGDIYIDSISTLEISLSDESSYTGTINGENTANGSSLLLDSDSTITLTGDSYISSLSDENTTYSNINFNGYTLYVNGTAYTDSSSLTSLATTTITTLATGSEDDNSESENSESYVEFTLSDSTHTFNNVTNYAASSENNDSDTDTDFGNTTDDNTTNTDDTTSDNTTDTTDSTTDDSSTNTSNTSDTSTTNSSSSNSTTTNSSSSDTSSSDSTNNTTDSTDNTTASGTMPYTGTTNILKIVILGLIIITLGCFVKYKSLEY